MPVRGSSAVDAVAGAVAEEEAAVDVVAGADASPGSWVSVGAVDCAAGAGVVVGVELELLEPLLFVEPEELPELPELVVFEPLLDGPNGSEYWSSPAPP